MRDEVVLPDGQCAEENLGPERHAIGQQAILRAPFAVAKGLVTTPAGQACQQPAKMPVNGFGRTG